MIAWLRAVLRERRDRRRLREVERWARYWQARAQARDHDALHAPPPPSPPPPNLGIAENEGGWSPYQCPPAGARCDTCGSDGDYCHAFGEMVCGRRWTTDRRYWSGGDHADHGDDA